jgi:hypothetical protein
VVGLKRIRGDPAPESPRAVLLVPLAGRASAAALRQAREAAAGGPLAVLALLKVHGYALGMPNPGLLPTAKEKEAQLQIVSDAIARLEQMKCDVDGQVAMTRHAARVIASVAKNRGVHHVIIEQTPVSAVRRALEGDVIASVRRRLGDSAALVVIEAPAAPAPEAAPRR